MEKHAETIAEKDFRRRCKNTHKICMSKKEAQEVINFARTRKTHRRKEIPVRIYLCEFCGNYHTTHQDQKKKFGNEKQKKEIISFKRKKENEMIKDRMEDAKYKRIQLSRIS